MKRSLSILIASLFAMSGIAQDISIGHPKMTEANGVVSVRFTARFNRVKSNEKLIVTPVLYTHAHTKQLPPIVVMGRNKSISEQRNGTPDAVKTPDGESIPYTATIPYEEWMSEVSLRVDKQIETCCVISSPLSLDVAVNQLIHYDLQPVYDFTKIKVEPTALQKYDQSAAFLYPITDYALRYEALNAQRAEGALKIYFKQGRSAIDPEFGDNARTLEQVRNAISLIQSSPEATLEKIVILGLASPEGKLSVNAKLAFKRAQALKKALADEIKKIDQVVDIIPADEDWDGLSKLVESSDMPYREEVLKLINQYPVRQGREKQLMDFKGGRPYRYMLEHFFPKLRNAGYIQIYYDLKPDTTVAEINRAIEFINNKEYVRALEILRPLEPVARVDNLMGVALMMDGNYTEAEIHFNRAIEGGDEQAIRNMEQIKKKQSVAKE